MQILLIEDDRMIGWALSRGLTDEGFGVDWLDDGDAAVIACSLASGAAPMTYHKSMRHAIVSRA